MRIQKWVLRGATLIFGVSVLAAYALLPADDVVRQFLSKEVFEMRGVTKTGLGVLLVLFGVATAGVTAAAADEDVKMVFHVEGMR